MISVIITAKNEANSIGLAVGAVLEQGYKQDEIEIIVVAPDQPSLDAAKRAGATRVYRDSGQGKPLALNLGIKKANGDILVFSDGDVLVATGAIKALVEKINQGADAVSSRPISIESSENKYGFWSHVLVSMADRIRLQQSDNGSGLLLSGYLIAVKADILRDFLFLENILTDDEYLSYYLISKNYNIKYAPEAKVKVKYADNFKDWKNQKIRSVGGSFQIPREWKQVFKVRGFLTEFKGIVFIWHNYGTSLKHKYWLVQLFLARFYVWLLAFIKIKCFKLDSQKMWKRINSSK